MSSEISRALLIAAIAVALVTGLARAIDVPALLAQGEALVQQGKGVEALKLYESRLSSPVESTNAALLGQMARLLYESQDFLKATAFIASLLDKGVQEPLLYYYRARVAFDERDEAKGSVGDDLDAVLAAIPKHIGATVLKAMYLRGTVHEDEEHPATAEGEAVKAKADALLALGLSYAPVTADDYEQQASGHMYEQDLDNAASLTKAALALNPTRPSLYLIRCLVLVSQEEMDEGTKDCEKARDLARPGSIREAIESVLELLSYARSGANAHEHGDEEVAEDENEDEDAHDGHAHAHSHGHGHNHNDKDGQAHAHAHSHSHGHAHEHGEGCNHDHDDL